MFANSHGKKDAPHFCSSFNDFRQFLTAPRGRICDIQEMETGQSYICTVAINFVEFKTDSMKTTEEALQYR